MASLSQWFYGHLYVATSKFRDEILQVGGPQQCTINNHLKETGTFDSNGLTLLTVISNRKKNFGDTHHGKLMDRKDHHHQGWPTGNNLHFQATVILQNNEGKV